MTKKKIIAITCICIALFGIMTMTGCGGGDTEPTEPKIKTTIDPKNWARVEDYAVYEDATEPTETTAATQAPTEPEATEAPAQETQPAETTPPPADVYYNVAKDMTRAFISSDLGTIYMGETPFSFLTNGVAELEDAGFSKGAAEKNSGVGYQYFFDGYKYSGENGTIYVDADSKGEIRAVKITDGAIAVVDAKISVGMPLKDFYDAIESVVSEGNISRVTPSGVTKSYTHIASAGYRAVFTCTASGLQEIAIFVEDYVLTWGPISK